MITGTAAMLADSSCPKPVQFVTQHQTAIGGQKISFTATAGETYLFTDAGQPSGSIFSYAYVQEAPVESQRPVMFVVCGGPGAASHLLQVGLLGPWTLKPDRLAITAERQPRAIPPFDIVENPHSLLDVTDLVFIDPVGTGYSRAVGQGRSEDFWGLDADLDSLAQFIQLWVTKHGRWNSPKFFLGESYGGTRAALIPGALAGGPRSPGITRGLTLNGVVILVNGLGYPLGTKGIGPHWLAATEFPSLAAAAWYHQKIDRRGRTLEFMYEEARRFAVTEYLTSLRAEADNTLNASDRTAVVAKLAEFTGLSATAFSSKLALTRGEFAKLLLADKGLEISTYDCRFSTPLCGGGGDVVADDALLARTFPVYTGAFFNSEYQKLNVQMDRPYIVAHFRNLVEKWNMYDEKRRLWTPGFPPAEQTNSEELATAMHRNDRLHAMIATGYYDMVMPLAQARHAAETAELPQARTILRAYESGHHPYLDKAALVASDLRQFVRTATGDN